MNKNLYCLFFFSLTLLLSGCPAQPSSEPESKESTKKEQSSGTDAETKKSAEPAKEPEVSKKPEKKSAPAPKIQASSEAKTPVEYVNPLTSEQIVDGWINLFDAQTLFGWNPLNEVNWAVDEKAITASEGPIGLLLTKVRFADFKLKLEYKLSSGGNSGVFLRCAQNPSAPGKDCYEINLADEHPEGYLTGSVVGLHRFDPQTPTADGQWHQLEITANQKELTVVMDGKITTQFKDERPEWLQAGFIGLQKNSGEIAFRNIQLKPLNPKSLFNGKDLTGWREVPGSQSEFKVVDESIHVTNGAGFLETEEMFANFAVQFEAKTHAPELNSGLFFRALPGTEKAPSHGYEVQIHNGYKEKDRNKPANAGTGAIFRRANARRVVSSDNQWCTVTLIADGPQISTWVDGYQVVDWIDTRKPDSNPRKGLKVEKGHLSLQGHDPTTDLSFRRFNLFELP